MLASGAISEIALIFVTEEGFDAQLDKALALVGRQLGVSRCYLFINSPDDATMTNTHEWCAEGIEPHRDRWQEVPYAALPMLKEILRNEAVHAIDDIVSLSEDMRRLLGQDGLRSILLAPLLEGSRVQGFLGFDECRRRRVWNNVEIETLKTIAGIISTAYSKKLLAERLTVSETNFRNFFDTVDEIIVIADLKGRILYANDEACRKLGYSLDELRGMEIPNLHPEDKRNEAREILQAMMRKERTRCPLELEAGNGIRIPVETRAFFGEWNGEACIFGISKDLSAEQAALQKFERLFRNNPTAMAMASVDSKVFIDANETFLEKTGYTRDEVIGKSSLDLDLFVDEDRWLAVREEMGRSGSVRDVELRLRRKDGTLHYGLFSGEFVQSQGERFLLSVMTDITEQVELRADLEAEHMRLANIIESTRLGTWEWDIRTGQTVFNERWAGILGYTLAELVPTDLGTWKRLSHPEDLAAAERSLAIHFEGKTEYFEVEGRMRHKDGRWIWILDRGKVVERDAAGHPLKMYGTHMDITEKKLMEDRIHELAIRDPLTDIFNRRYIFERLEEVVAEYRRTGRNFCISLMDLDHFKAVNDTYGHQAGDYILTEFAASLRASIRQYDILGRYGGEEFILISLNAGAKEAAAAIERVMSIVRAATYSFKGKSIRYTFSCGVADSGEFQRDQFSSGAIISLADTRLYVAKENGRNRLVGP